MWNDVLRGLTPTFSIKGQEHRHSLPPQRTAGGQHKTDTSLAQLRLAIWWREPFESGHVDLFGDGRLGQATKGQSGNWTHWLDSGSLWGRTTGTVVPLSPSLISRYTHWNIYWWDDSRSETKSQNCRGHRWGNTVTATWRRAWGSSARCPSPPPALVWHLPSLGFGCGSEVSMKTQRGENVQ